MSKEPEFRTLGEELEWLEKHDPDVRRAASTFQAMVEHLNNPEDYAHAPKCEDCGAYIGVCTCDT